MKSNASISIICGDMNNSVFLYKYKGTKDSFEGRGLGQLISSSTILRIDLYFADEK
jgi:hypothetical protein